MAKAQTTDNGITVPAGMQAWHLANRGTESPKFVPATGKAAANNPDRLGYVYATFHAIRDGKVQPEALSYTAKEITLDDARNPNTVVDVANGLLILPAGERGRKPAVGASQDAINDLLAAARANS